jgi:hypothetical protein
VTKLNPTASGSASLLYSTFLAAFGSGQDSSSGNAIAVDSSGNAYVAEYATAGFPATSGAYDFEGSDQERSYFAKVNTMGTALTYSAFLGPGDPSGIALDGDDEVFVTGTANYGDFPITSGAYQTIYPGGFRRCRIFS